MSNHDKTEKLLLQGVIADKYRVISLLGKGGMGTVYKIEHVLLKKTFALKVLSKELSKEESMRQRFIQEATLAMEFSHEHAIQIRDFGETEDGQQYFTMDFSSGVSLAELISKGRFDEKRALNIARQVLKALESAHNKDIAHRDLKPANILIENRLGKDHALVLDFGIAKILRQDNNKDLTGKAVLGTPHYMSPEQVSGKGIDTRTDLYSLGVILYEMLTEKRPFSGQSSMDVMVARLLKPPPQIRSICANISEHAEKIVDKALKQELSLRFKDAREFIVAIDGKQIVQKEDRLTEEKSETKILENKKIAALETEVLEPAKAETEKETDFRKQKNLSLITLFAFLFFAFLFFVFYAPKKQESAKAVKNGKKKAKSSKRTEINNSKKAEINDGSFPLGWPKNLWQKCYNGKWLDFTHVDWQALNVKEHINYAKSYQKWYAKKQRVGLEKKIVKADVNWKFILIPPGKFWMGSEQEHPRHKVTISKAFWMGKYEVTQKQWLAVTGKKFWARQKFVKDDPDHAVSVVSWQSIKKTFLPSLGLEFQLPSEAQWEYAARAGTLTRFYWGEETQKLEKHSWHRENTIRLGHSYPHKVAQKQANPWGLFDIMGNVLEWCEDDWHKNYVDAPTDGSSYVEKSREKYRVVRGGSYMSSIKNLHISRRGKFYYQSGLFHIGFRIMIAFK